MAVKSLKNMVFAAAVATGTILPSFAATLPAEYQELEYIQASGQCRIKTSVTPAYNDKVEMTWMPTTVSGNQNLWCARTATSKQFTGFMIGATFRFDRNEGKDGQITSATAFVANTRYSIVADYGAGISTISNDVTHTEVTTVSNTTDSYTVGSVLAIFASHNNNIDDGLNNYGSYRLYSFKLRNSSGALRLDLVPAKRLSDDALGVYDMVNGDFLTNDKSGSFIAGPNVGNTYTWIGGASGSLSTAANWSPAPAGAFTAADELIVNDAAEITVDAAATVRKITLNASGAVSFTGANALTVLQIANAGVGTATFGCPVNFSGMYYVEKIGELKFPGGATATYPDPLMRTSTSTANARTLDGEFTFTADWIVNNVGDYPWIVASNSVVRGQNFSGTQTSHHRILRVEETGYACFTTTTNGWDRGDIDIDGTLEATEEMIVRTKPSSASDVSHFGRSGNIGTVKAKRIAKAEHAVAQSLIPNLIVGSGGIGSLCQDYLWRFEVDTTITAMDDFEVLAVYRSGGLHDWGIGSNGSIPVTITFNVPEGKTVTFGTGFSGSTCTIRKTGAGTLVMTDTFNGNSGFIKQYANGTVIEEGTVRLAANGQLGTGPVTIGANGTLEIASGVTMSNVLDGEGTLRLEDGVTVSVGTTPWHAGTVEVASGATVTVTNTTGAASSIAFVSGVSAADLPRFTITGNTLAVVDGVLVATGNTTGAYVWNGANGADWSVPGNWLVDGVVPATAPASTDTIVFENAAPVTVGGTDPLTVAKIVTLSYDEVTFNCPVQFAGTYLVQNAATAPVFAGGATATYPDASLSNENIPSHALRGTVTFTDDWTVPDQPAGNPFVVAAGARLYGKTVTAAAYQNVNYHLRIDEGAIATFETVAVAGKLVFRLNGGRLVATGDVTLGGDATKHDFCYYNGNVGTIEANGIYKSVTSVGLIYYYAPDVVVGAGGFGMYRKDYNIQFQVDSKLTAKANLAIHQPISGDGPKDGDWGLNLNGKTFTIDTASYTVTFDSWVSATAAKIVKEGEGEMIMQSRLKQHTGGTVLNGGLTTVKLAGALGYGTATVNSGATLAFADSVVNFAYPIVVNEGATLANAATVADTSTLTLNAGAILKPVQNTFFDLSGGTLVLPDEGAITVDMTDFTFVNGVPNPLLEGVVAGDEAKFTALVPAGIVGSLSVSNGFLYYTVTSGGSAAADLFWHPQGDETWSTAVAAWTNAAGSQVVFTPYANVTVADAATISLPNDVSANDVNIAADGDVALNGSGKLGGPGTVIKTGEGTLTFNATGGLDAQPIIVSNGVLKVGDDLVNHALGAAADSSPVIVADGGTLDLNYNVSTSNSDASRSSVTRDKLVRIAGDGFNGQGAIVNNSYESLATLSDLVLDADASVGGSKRFDVRGNQSNYARNSASINGPGKTLTVKTTSPGAFGIVNATVNLDSIVVTNGGVFRMEGATYHLDRGVRLVNGGTVDFYAGTYPADVAITAESGENTIKNSSGTVTFNGPITVSPGATLTHTGGNIVYNGAINGTIAQSGGYSYYNGGAPANGWTVNGAKASERVYMRQSGTFTGADITAAYLCIADVADSTVDVTFNDSTIDLLNFFQGWGGVANGSCSIGPGTTLTTTKISIGDTGSTNVATKTSIKGWGPTNTTAKSVLSVDGGEVRHTGTTFFIAYSGPHADFILNSGTVTVDQASIQLRGGNALLGGYNTARFIQNGGVFNYGGTGFTAKWEDNTDDGQIILKGGTFNASTNWSIPCWISTCFKGGDANGWTLNQADGTTATWTTALSGEGDVTLNGAATLAGNKEVQGAAGGKWTVGDGFTAGLEGAASFLGGLDIGEGASVTVDIAADRSAVFTARDFGYNPGAATGAQCITNRFNKALGGTTRGTITHDETFMFNLYAAADRPFGNLNYQSTYALGQFYVEEGAAGTWSFTGKCDDYVQLWVDGVLVIATTGASNTGIATKELAAGWHSFRHVIIDNSGSFGQAQTIGYKDGSGTMSSYANFSVKNLKMRPAADMGDANNANTVRWSHYKGTSSTVTASTFKNQDFAWDFCCITNNLQKLNWYGQNDAMMNTYTVNRYEGWFYVTAENADKTWTFRSQYDDRCALWIDGVDTELTGGSGNTLTYAVTLSQGWHSFRIQTADFTGNAGPWSGKGNSVSYQVAGGSQTFFSEATLPMTVCPDGYVQGGVTLASGATLANAATGVATVYGDVTATGTGATVSGGFKFEGGTLAFQNVDPGTRDLSSVLAFANPAEDFLADVGAVTVDFAAKPIRGRVTVCPAGGLTSETAAAKVRVTVNGEPLPKATAFVEDGKVKVRFNRGFCLILH
ncbi:MAG: hypothetical protein J6T51_08200 [Kiritimatiellae bacterium]|nr:hypothetical protein [Kiritimatiellia bacterium]